VTTILVVDDSAFARRVHRRVLESAGYHVIEAATGMGALETFSLERPDLVLLDLSMEDLGGVDVLRKLREIAPDVRVIVASADIQRSTEQLVMENGASRFLGKPVADDVLLGAVRLAVAESRA
jgi:two-component system chemotaxis response regulator CheY